MTAFSRSRRGLRTAGAVAMGAGLLLGPTGCPDVSIPPIGGSGLRVCSADEVAAFRQASSQDVRDDLWIAFVDVGHGDATWIRTPGQIDVDAFEILVDAGDCRLADGACGIPAGTIPDDGGPDGVGALMDFMAESEWGRGSTIHYFVVTHPDKDHYGGVFQIAENYQVRNYATSGKESQQSTYLAALARLAQEPGVKNLTPVEVTGLEPNRIGREGAAGPQTTQTWGRDLTVTLLSANRQAVDDNDASVILLLEYRNVRILLGADAQTPLDERLVATVGDALQADVLRTGHHGGIGTSTSEFLAKVFPAREIGRKFAIVSAGEREGLPRQEVIDRLEAAVGAGGVYRTDRLDEGKNRRQAPGDDHVIMRVTAEGDLTVCYAYPDTAIPP